MTHITISDLVDKGACFSQRRTFTELFPNGVDVTVELAVKHADVFDWDWAAENLLTDDLYTKFRETYNNVHDAANDAFREAHRRNNGVCGKDCAEIAHNMYVKEARTFAELYLTLENKE